MTLTIKPGIPMQRLLPAGRFDAPRGAMQGEGPWYLDSTKADALIARARLRGADIPMDYEHQILLSAKNGQPAPASGWIAPSSLQWVSEGAEPGVYGRVSWTPRAAALIEAREYRYMSPVFSYGTNGAVVDLLHVALTQTPAIELSTPPRTLAAGSQPRSVSSPLRMNESDREKYHHVFGFYPEHAAEHLALLEQGLPGKK